MAQNIPEGVVSPFRRGDPDLRGTFPNEISIIRLIGAVLFGQNDEWQTASRYMQVETFVQIDNKETNPILSIATQAA